MSDQKLTIIVSSCDPYADLWDDFFELFNKYWGNRNYKTFLVTNKLHPDIDHVQVINTEIKDQWSTRMRKTLDAIESKYVCMLLEDLYLSAQISNNEIEKIINLMETDSLRYYKLNTFSNMPKNTYKNYNYIHSIPKNLNYGISLQAAIWNKEFLYELIGEGDYNAWEFEMNRLKESVNADNIPLDGCVYDDRNILHIVHGVVQGKFLPSAVKQLRNIGFELNTSPREIMSFKEYAYYKLKLHMKDVLPIKVTKGIKPLLSKAGFKFVVK